MDETMLHSMNFSIIYILCKNFKIDIPYHLAFYYFRPGLAEFIQKVNSLKKNGTLKYVYIFTSASNHNDYITFMKNSIETFTNCHGFFDDIISKEHQHEIAPDGATVKNLDIFVNSINKPDITIDNGIIIDDKPGNVQRANVYLWNHMYNILIFYLLLKCCLIITNLLEIKF